MKQLYLDPVTHDLVITSAYNIRLTETIGEYVSQKIESTLRWYRSEWFLDRAGGVPYFDTVLGKADLNEVNALFLSIVAGVSGVAEALSFGTNYDGQSRTYTVTWTVRADEGAIVEGGTTL